MQGQKMDIELKVTYTNADSGARIENGIDVSSDDEILIRLAKTCQSRPTEKNFETLFKKMYDNPNMNGVDAGILYNEVWAIMSRWAFDKLGWHDVTVDVIGLIINGELTSLEAQVEIDLVDYQLWSLRLSREGFMYCKN